MPDALDHHNFVLNYDKLLQEMESKKMVAREMIKTARKMRRVAAAMRKLPRNLRLP